MEYENRMKLNLTAGPQTRAFARVAVAAFLSQMNPTLEEVADVKTALSEAVTNCVVHAYEGKVEKITVECMIRGQELTVLVEDKGCGDVRQAMGRFSTQSRIPSAAAFALLRWRLSWIPWRWESKSRQGHESGDEKKDRKNSE